jgi:signal peptidase I
VDATPPPASEPHSPPDPLPLPAPTPAPVPVADAPLPLPADTPAADEAFPPIGFTLRRLCHILVLLFCLLLVIRTTFVEPFGVTTGSMAQTVLGNRRERVCPQCGHAVCVGTPEEYGDLDPQNGVTCPNCGFGPLDLRNEDETFGDRLLVDKLTLRLRPPHRWEVAVFRCPDPKERRKPIDRFTPLDARLPVYEDRVPCENRTYVKRVVGLPGERIRIWDGDVYANGQLQRKDLATVREVRIPVFRMAASPSPNGWASRWEVGPPAASGLPNVVPPKLPAVADVVQGTALVLDATAAPFGLTYRHRKLGTQTDETVTDGLGYNGRGTDFAADDKRKDIAVHDFMVECQIEVVSGEKGAFEVRLMDGADGVTVHLPIHADTTGGTPQVAHDRTTRERPFDTPFALVPGKKYALEFAFIDRRVLVAIDGKQVVAPLDLPPVSPKNTTDPAGKRGGTDRPVQMGCRGGHVVVRQFTIWRDIHYRDGTAKHAVKGECQLGADEYFMLGDNSANSGDSREWATPGVPERDFLGKPFLVHQPLRRANPPLFGLKQVIDWERFRLLR